MLNYIQREIQEYGQGVGPSSTALDRKYYDEIQTMRYLFNSFNSLLNEC